MFKKSLPICRAVSLCVAVATCGEPLPECGFSVPSWPGEPPLNEPANFRVFNQQPWRAVDGNGWGYARRSSSKNDDVCADTSVSRSGASALRIIFTPDMQRDNEPSTHLIVLPRVPAAYAAWWIKLSANWTPSPAGGGKIAFLWAADGLGQAYTGLFGSSEPHHISVNTEWAPYGQRIWDPNVTETPIQYNRWYRIEWYAEWESSPGAGDGVMRWWVDGVLNGDYTTITYPFPPGFIQFEFAPTLQFPPPAEQYMYVGYTYLSVPGD